MRYEHVEIKDICKIKSGKRLPKGTDFADGMTNFPYIRARDIKAGVISGDDLAYLTEDVQKRIQKYIVNTNDIVITIVGASVGDVGYVKEEFKGFNLTENAVRLTDFDERVNSQYLLYILNSKKYWELMQQIAGGSAQPKLGIYKIESIPLELPPIEVQNKIVEIVLSYDALIENNQKQIKLLEEAAQRLYKEWFVDLRFPGYEDVAVVDGVPEGWHRGQLKELINVNYGKDHKKAPDDGDIPVYGSGGLMRKCNKSLFTGEAVLIPRKGSLNHIMYVNEEFWTVDTMFYATMKREHTAFFVYFFISGFDMYSMNIGAAVPSMTVKILDAMDVIIPSDALFEEFDDIVQVFFRRIAILRKQNEELEQARDRLLPKLMSGELEV